MVKVVIVCGETVHGVGAGGGCAPSHRRWKLWHFYLKCYQFLYVFLTAQLAQPKDSLYVCVILMFSSPLIYECCIHIKVPLV